VLTRLVLEILYKRLDDEQMDEFTRDVQDCSRSPSVKPRTKEELSLRNAIVRTKAYLRADKIQVMLGDRWDISQKTTHRAWGSSMAASAVLTRLNS
jgi:hypothetical protein